MTAMLTNGRARKSLADQIDRLDRTLDGLSDGLNDAVAQAVKEAVSVAVEQAISQVLRELLDNPLLLAQLQGAACTHKNSNCEQPSMIERLGRACRRLVGGLTSIGVVCWGRVGDLAAVVMSAIVDATNAIGARLRQMREQIGVCCWQLRQTIGAGCSMLRQLLALSKERWQLVRRVAGVVLTAGLVGGVLAVLAYFAGPLAASAISAASGFTATLASQAVVMLRRRIA